MDGCRSFIILAVTALLASQAQADSKRVFLEQSDGTRIEIAALDFEGKGYAVTMVEAPFTDHFLSMRPFKCLEGPQTHWCHVPYPYEIARDISADLVDLEYDFLFVWKGATEYGINMWNGVYYRLEADGDRFVGTLHEMDMGMLAVPPDAGVLRPIGKWDVEESDPDSHWLPVLIIE